MCSGVWWQSVDAGKERQQRYIAKRYAVTRFGEGFEHYAVGAEGGVEVLRKFDAGVALHFDGRELPHAGKKNVIVRTGIFHEQCAALGIAENGGRDFDVDRSALLARCGNFIG